MKGEIASSSRKHSGFLAMTGKRDVIASDQRERGNLVVSEKR
jgi:hypothetical protein